MKISWKDAMREETVVTTSWRGLRPGSAAAAMRTVSFHCGPTGSGNIVFSSSAGKAHQYKRGHEKDGSLRQIIIACTFPQNKTKGLTCLLCQRELFRPICHFSRRTIKWGINVSDVLLQCFWQNTTSHQYSKGGLLTLVHNYVQFQNPIKSTAILVTWIENNISSRLKIHDAPQVKSYQTAAIF